MMKKNSKWIKISYADKVTLFSSFYAFLHRIDLTNPEVTFFMTRADTGEALTISSSRNGDYNGERLPDTQKWRELTSSPHLRGILSVAATDRADTRRVVVSYSVKDNSDCSLLVSFPNALNGLNAAEKHVLESLRVSTGN